MVDFATLKKNSKGSLDRLTGELAKLNKPNADTGGKDERFWYPAVDKAGNGYSVIRFLPAPGDEDVPFVRLFEHGFKGPTGLWYFENSLTTIGKEDPVGQLNSKLWNSTSDDNSPQRKQARDQKRKLSYISNIYIIQDQLNPENNGKVFLFKFGKKIFDKLNEAMVPQFADESPLNPFDLWAGANFKLRIRNVEGYRNYDRSEFSTSEPLSNDDTMMESVWKQAHSLQAFLDPSNFKSYDELKTKLDRVLGLNESGKVTPAAARATAQSIDDDMGEAEASWESSSTTTSDDDDDMEFFKKLAN